MDLTLRSRTSVILLLSLSLILLTCSARGQAAQIWGDAAHPQWQHNSARNGRISGAFNESELVVDNITLFDLADATYTIAEVGTPGTNCPANLSNIDQKIIYIFCGGVVQDDDFNIYSSCAFRWDSKYSTLTIKFALTQNRFGVDWVACTNNQDDFSGDFYYSPALYKGNDQEIYVIVGDYYNSQFALRSSDGSLAHVIDNTVSPERYGSILITSDGYVVHPANVTGATLASTSDPLTAISYTFTSGERQSRSDFIRTLGSSEFSYVVPGPNLTVSFYDTLGQASATTVFVENRTTSAYAALVGLADGRAVVVYDDLSLTVLDYNGANANFIDGLVGFNGNIALHNGLGLAAEGADGHVYMLTDGCGVVRADISGASMELFNYTINGSCSGSYGLGTNDDGVFFASYETAVVQNTCIIRINKLRYGSSTIEQISQFDCDYYAFLGNGRPQRLRFQLMPGSFVATLDTDTTLNGVSDIGEGRLFFFGHWPTPSSDGSDGTDGNDDGDGGSDKKSSNLGYLAFLVIIPLCCLCAVVLICVCPYIILVVWGLATGGHKRDA